MLVSSSKCNTSGFRLGGMVMGAVKYLPPFGAVAIGAAYGVHFAAFLLGRRSLFKGFLFWGIKVSKNTIKEQEKPTESATTHHNLL